MKRNININLISVASRRALSSKQLIGPDGPDVLSIIRYMTSVHLRDTVTFRLPLLSLARLRRVVHVLRQILFSPSSTSTLLSLLLHLTPLDHILMSASSSIVILSIRFIRVSLSLPSPMVKPLLSFATAFVPEILFVGVSTSLSSSIVSLVLPSIPCVRACDPAGEDDGEMVRHFRFEVRELRCEGGCLS